MIIENDSHQYEVGSQVAVADTYRLYLCTQIDTGRQCLLQIAAEADHNGALDRAAYLLGVLEKRAIELEAEYANIRTDQHSLLNYNLGFPELVDDFLCQEQGERRINILGFRNVDDVSQMIPIRNITDRDRQRVDLRTSAWIMGKTLKLLVFAHSLGIAVRRLDGANILIEPNEHYVVIFDWSEALTYPGEIPAEARSSDITQVAQAVISLLGGDHKVGSLPNDEGENFTHYIEYLLRLADGSQHSAVRAHKRFYEIVDGTWEHAFYPFTALPLNH